MITFSMFLRFGNGRTNGLFLIFCNTLFAFIKPITTWAFMVNLSWQTSKQI